MAQNFSPIQKLLQQPPARIPQVITPMQKSQIPVSLPRLMAAGDKIIRTDTKEPIQLKGVTSNAFRYPWKGEPDDLWGTGQQLPYASEKDIIRSLQVVKDMGGNAINFYIQPETIGKKIDILEKVIDWANTSGMYVSLIPADFPYKEGVMNKKVDQSLELLASRFKNRSNVLYGLWAEPGQIEGTFSNEKWLPRADELTRAIRKHDPQSLVILAGENYARDLGPLQEKPFPHQNILYDFHDYPYASIATDRGNDRGDSNYQWMLGKNPVLMGEYGKYWEKDFGTPQDVAYIKEILDKVNQKKMHSFGYALDEINGLGFYDPKGGMSQKGLAYKEDLSKYPPTSFTPIKRQIEREKFQQLPDRSPTSAVMRAIR